MKKLNNRGWGMSSFLIIVGLLLLVILLIAFLVNEYDDGLPSSRRIENREEKNLDD